MKDFKCNLGFIVSEFPLVECLIFVIRFNTVLQAVMTVEIISMVLLQLEQRASPCFDWKDRSQKWRQAWNSRWRRTRTRVSL